MRLSARLRSEMSDTMHWIECAPPKLIGVAISSASNSVPFIRNSLTSTRVVVPRLLVWPRRSASPGRELRCTCPMTLRPTSSAVLAAPSMRASAVFAYMNRSRVSTKMPSGAVSTSAR